MSETEAPKPKRKRGGWPVYKPPGGEGWGGPAKGFVPNPNKRKIATAETMAIARERGKLPEYVERRALRKAQAEALLDHIHGLATTAERQETQLAAAKAFIERVEGQPTARQEISGPEGKPLAFDLSRLTQAELDTLEKLLDAGDREGAGEA